MLACTLPKPEWTHEAHLAACLWVIVERHDIMPERDLGGYIRAYNSATGVINDATQGYHETITQCYIAGIRQFLAGATVTGLHDQVNGLLDAPQGQRDWPLRFYSRELLFSSAARLGFVAPDLADLPV